MAAEYELENLAHMVWLLLHRTYNVIAKCEDDVFAKQGITPEQHAVLLAIKYIDEPATPTDVGQLLDRNTNSISLIVERMVKAGLLKRRRDLPDRRSCRLVITRQAREILERATPAGWELTLKVLSRLSLEDRRTLVRLLEIIREDAIKCRNPQDVADDIKADHTKNIARFIERLSDYACIIPPATEDNTQKA
jgi:DNA-binding MarR family transcriptional regulator